MIASSCRHSPLGLLELIAMVRVIKEIGEVREQVQAVVQQKPGCADGRWANSDRWQFRRDALAGHLSAIGTVEESKKRDDVHSVIDRLWYLVSRVPLGPVAHARHRESVSIVAAAVPKHAVHLL